MSSKIEFVLGLIIAVIGGVILAHFLTIESQVIKLILLIGGMVEIFLVVFCISISFTRNRMRSRNIPQPIMLDCLKDQCKKDESIKRIEGTLVSKTWILEQSSDDDDEEVDDGTLTKKIKFLGNIYE